MVTLCSHYGISMHGQLLMVNGAWTYTEQKTSHTNLWFGLLCMCYGMGMTADRPFGEFLCCILWRPSLSPPEQPFMLCLLLPAIYYDLAFWPSVPFSLLPTFYLPTIFLINNIPYRFVMLKFSCLR